MLQLHSEDHVGWATIARPEKLNAMTRGFWRELRDVMDTVEQDPETRCLVFHGAGSCFSVGGDIAAFGELNDALDRREYVQEALGALRAVEAMSKPVIAAVHGAAFGGGCELTMVCDIVIADETATFGTPEAAVGLVPGLGLVRGLAHLNLRWMKYMVLTGLPLDAAQARDAGLVNVVVSEGQHVEEARRLAETISTRAPLALKVGKQALGRHADEGYGYAIEAIAFLMGSADVAEGIQAFKERRAPQFEGR